MSLWAAWRDDAQSLLVALAVLAIAFFVVPTRAHERYLFPFFGLGAVLLAVSWRWSVAYLALTVVNAANLLAVLVQYQGIPTTDGTIAGTLNDWGNGILTATWFDGLIWPIAVCSVVTGLAMVWALLQLRRRAVAGLEREIARAALEPESGGWWSTIGPVEPFGEPDLPETTAAAIPSGDATAAVELPSNVGAASSLALRAEDTRPGRSQGFEPSEEAEEAEEYVDDEQYDEYEDWEEDVDYLDGPGRPQYVPHQVMRVWRRLARRSTSPDRTASLDSEPRGRLDKLDIWVVVALVVAVLSMRIYRLDEPMQMHFDEVYHARSATEFLQDWRYNIPHNVDGVYIYEWTHPMLAKYAIAAGITLFSDDKVTATGDLDVTVKATLVQPRTATSPTADPNNPDAADTGQRFGDRVFVATGSDVRVYDLQTRALVQTFPIPGASSFSAVGPTGLVYVGTSSGAIYRIDTTSLDDVQNGVATTPKAPTELAVSAGLSITHLYSGTPPYLLASDDAGDMVSIDLSQNGGTVVAHGVVPGAADFADLGVTPTVLVKSPTATAPPPSEQQALATALALDQTYVEDALNATTPPGVNEALNVGPLSSAQVTAVQDLITKGQLPDIQVVPSDPQAIVAYKSGVGLLDVRRLIVTSTIATDAPATSIALNYSDLQGTSINTNQASYVAAGDSIVLIHPDTSGGPGTLTKDSSEIQMPGPVTQVVFDGATRVAQALGRTPDGKGWTVYAIETNGDAVFSDAPLPFQPAAIGLDSTPTLPDTDREQVLAFSSDGSMATVDVGQFAFSWRIIGVLFGALMAACLYLLARVLFRRRSIGLLVALFSLTDGMLFVQSRIAMNDTYVGGFLLLAYLLFAILWLNVWKSRIAFWVTMPILGVILGLGLASKWVALYAIASIGILILIRSALGRLITILGLAAGTGVLGWMAIAEMTTEPNTGSPVGVILLIGLALAVVVGGFVWAFSVRTTPDKVFVWVVTAVVAAGLFGAALLLSPGTIQNGAPNYTFFILMLTITAVAAAANAYHPIAWTREELWFAIGAPIVIGVLAGAAGVVRQSGLLLEVGAAGIAAGAAAAVAFRFAGGLGFGPLAVPPGPDDPSRFAEPAGARPHRLAAPGLGLRPAGGLDGRLPAGPADRRLRGRVHPVGHAVAAGDRRHRSAAGHRLLARRAGHRRLRQRLAGRAHRPDALGSDHRDVQLPQRPARLARGVSSPWWAWPMDLKPVWFESIGYADDAGSMIYDGGNPALWWMAIVAMAFVCWQAFKRRSLGLTLIAVAFFWQWLSWARIDRAAFQYHFYTALPFFLLALAYFLAELWHGPSRRTWLLARVAAAAALLFPAAAWLLKYPLCGLARVEHGRLLRQHDLRQRDGRRPDRDADAADRHRPGRRPGRLWRSSCGGSSGARDAGQDDQLWILQLLVPVGIAGVLLWWLGQNGPRDIIFQAALPSDGIALVLLPILAVAGVRRPDRPQPAPVRARRLRLRRRGVRGPVSEPLGPADAEHDHQRLRRPAADLVLRLPVLGQPAGVRLRSS